MKSKTVVMKTFGKKKIETTSEDRIWVREFTEEAVQKLAASVYKISEKDEQEPIVVYVDSYGGYIHACLGMIGILDSVKNPIITVAVGKAMSAGAVLLSHGDIRCMGPHAVVMVHEALGGAGGNVNDVKNDTAELGRINDYLMGILAENCGTTTEKLKKLFKDRREVYLTSSQAKKFGIVDHIGIPSIEKHTGFQMHFLQQPEGK